VLREHGLTPGVATRGYKAHAGHPGDEHAEMLEHSPDLVIEADPDRIRAAQRVNDRGCDVVLLDDGFQHRRLFRDLDIVLIDSTRPVDRDSLLPLGYLREPVGSLARAHAVVITRCESSDQGVVDRLSEHVRQINTGLVIARAEHRWDSVDVNGERQGVATLHGRRVVLACGIGNPEAFIGNTVEHGAEIVERIVMGDHHRWSGADAERLVRACKHSGEGTALVTTAKDWVKLGEHLPAGTREFDVIVPRLSIVVVDGEAAVVALAVDAARGARSPGG
jgi:tetraacyldisaccharide 4'-kinase